ncbi:cilia- and flagella-associated protein 52-like [Ylistrum balloti]|uniref:cilia- and flagella-associated protein 52-like n=1 Tax=Ylistrum balloti TaxID=509963 RepID=UPI002905E7FC|nr:cilia- and flagella-associated protein 52-like [Ylistrum balloti]
MANSYDGPRLELEYIVGYNGIPNGLKVHPDRQHLIYSLGNTVIIENIETKKQQTLMGHSLDVSCITVSNTGKYIASGQVTHMGFKADIIIWNYEKRELYKRLQLHKVKIEALVFSPKDTFLLSLGGQDDGSVVVWDVKTKTSICGSPAQLESAGNTMCVAYHETDEYKFFTGGDCTLRVWELDVENRKIKPTDVAMGQYVRICKCIEMKGNYLLCGTTTGDILGVNVETKLFQFHGPGGTNCKKQKNFGCGVTALAHLHDKQMMLIGSGEGEVALVAYNRNKKNEWVFEKKRSWFDENYKKENVSVAAIALRGQGQQFFVGMTNSQIYRFNFADFSCELIKTAHNKSVTDISFSPLMNDAFMTSQLGQIRFWLLKNGRELWRHTEANITCTTVILTPNGQELFTAWDDGKIRGYGHNKNGFCLKFTIEDAHSNGVTALAYTSERKHRIISGGGEGQVRVWSVSEDNKTYSLKENMKEHRGSVSDIKISQDEKTCVSSSHDGTTIIWDMKTHKRSQIVFATTLFKCVVYNREGNQIVTGGTDKKLVYWDVIDGAKIRENDGSESGSINAMDISEDGSLIATGGDDKILKLWDYKKGKVISVGLGHSGNIQRIKISPKNTHIVSVSEDGAILVWKFPQHLVSNQQHREFLS